MENAQRDEAGKEPNISHCLIPSEYPDLERLRGSSDRPEHYSSGVLSSSSKSHGSTWTTCSPILYLSYAGCF